jgi:hypothetical protein
MPTTKPRRLHNTPSSKHRSVRQEATLRGVLCSSPPLFSFRSLQNARASKPQYQSVRRLWCISVNGVRLTVALAGWPNAGVAPRQSVAVRLAGVGDFEGAHAGKPYNEKIRFLLARQAKKNLESQGFFRVKEKDLLRQNIFQAGVETGFDLWCLRSLFHTLEVF